MCITVQGFKLPGDKEAGQPRSSDKEPKYIISKSQR